MDLKINAEDATKFNRLILFAERLPRLRAAIDKDLRRHGFPHAKAVALVISLRDETLIRVGNVACMKDFRTWGATVVAACSLVRRARNRLWRAPRR